MSDRRRDGKATGQRHVTERVDVAKICTWDCRLVSEYHKIED